MRVVYVSLINIHGMGVVDMTPSEEPLFTSGISNLHEKRVCCATTRYVVTSLVLSYIAYLNTSKNTVKFV